MKTRDLLSDGLTELGSSGKSEQSCNEPDDVPLLPPRIGVALADPAVSTRGPVAWVRKRLSATRFNPLRRASSLRPTPLCFGAYHEAGRG